MSKHEFMSPTWLDMARQRISDVLADRDLTGIDFTLCEEFTNPPQHLRRPPTPTIGFYLRVKHGAVEVGDHPIEDADVRVISDYADALLVARNPEAAAADPAAMAERIASGRLRIEGNPEAAPPILRDLDIHRLLATETA